MNLFISIINHGHDKLITTNSRLVSLAQKFKVIIKSNTLASEELSSFCLENDITLIQGKKSQGFGANNNDVFSYVKLNFKPKKEDYFLVLNPDVEIDVDSLCKLIELAKKYSADISAINLFTDHSLMTYDNSIRRYPKLLTPLKSALGINRNDIYNKSKIKQPVRIEWAAGSFLLFRIASFEKLDGFDEKYFMYFEDVDICTRANNIGLTIYYFPNIKGVHYASHKNRKLYSKHFIWYIESSFKYQLKYLFRKT